MDSVGLFSLTVVGLIAGFISSKIVNKRGEGLIRDILLGIFGALLGRFIFRSLGFRVPTGIGATSILVAVVGSVILLVIFHAVRSQKAAG